MCNIEHLPKMCAIWMCENMDEKYKRSFVTWQCLCRGHCFSFPRTLLLLQDKNVNELYHTNLLCIQSSIISSNMRETKRRKSEARGTLNQIGPHICLKFSQLYFTDNSHQSCAMSILTRRKLWSQLLPPHQWCPFFWFSLHLFTHTYPRDPWHFATPILCLSPHTHALLCY